MPHCINGLYWAPNQFFHGNNNNKLTTCDRHLAGRDFVLFLGQEVSALNHILYKIILGQPDSPPIADIYQCGQSPQSECSPLEPRAWQFRSRANLSMASNPIVLMSFGNRMWTLARIPVPMFEGQQATEPNLGCVMNTYACGPDELMHA